MNKINPIRQTDDEAITLAGNLLEKNRYGALAVLEPETSIPLVSRIAVASTAETGVFFLASDLSSHSKCLAANPVCSLMLGEPGKGDGLAHPRITLIGRASRLVNGHQQCALLRETFVTLHPKSKLYIDFSDFGFYPFLVERAQLNGGFGKAYQLEAEDLSCFFPSA